MIEVEHIRELLKLWQTNGVRNMIDIKVLASGSKGNAYYLSDGKSPLLLECGLPFKKIQQGLNFKTSELAGCLISHEHADHSKGVKATIKAGVDVYLSKGTAEALQVEGHRVNIVRSQKQFKLGSWEILPFNIEHDAVEPLGFLLASGDYKVLFATDTMYLRYKFVGLTHILIGVNYSDEILKDNVKNGAVDRQLKQRIQRSHMSLNTLLAFLKANDLVKLQCVYLLHLSDTNADSIKFKKTIQEVVGVPVYIG